MAEWLKRKTVNLLSLGRIGSNPISAIKKHKFYWVGGLYLEYKQNKQYMIILIF